MSLPIRCASDERFDAKLKRSVPEVPLCMPGFVHPDLAKTRLVEEQASGLTLISSVQGLNAK